MAGSALLCVSIGCHHQPKSAIGSMDRPGTAASVNNSWANAAKACWPRFAKTGATDQRIRQYLIDPAHLRATFPAYSALSDANVNAEITMPLTMIFPPDPTKLTNSVTPVLTRGQAVNGVPPGGAIVQHTGALNTVPADGLCSIQPGLPPDFRQ